LSVNLVSSRTESNDFYERSRKFSYYTSIFSRIKYRYCEQEVQAAINASGTYLPQDLRILRFTANQILLMRQFLTLALTSKTMPLTKVEDFADTRLAQKISQLPGVGLVSISGGQKPAVRIQVNSNALAGLGLNMEDIRLSLAQANVNQAKGNFDGPTQAFSIGANDQLLSSDGIDLLIVAYRNGAPVASSDVADIKDDPENVFQSAWMNQVPAVM